jgi:hypothetical protein
MAKVFAVRALYVFNECVELVEVGFMDFDKHGKVFHVISGGDDLIVARPRAELTIDQFTGHMASDTLHEFLDVDYMQTASAQWGGIAQWDHRYYFEALSSQTHLRNWHQENLRLFTWEPPACAC